MASAGQQWVHRHGDRGDPAHRAAIWAYRSCFTPVDPTWEVEALRNGRAALAAALAAVTSSSWPAEVGTFGPVGSTRIGRSPGVEAIDMHHPNTTAERSPKAPGDGATLDTVRDREGRCRLCSEPASEIRITDTAISALIVACGVCGWHAVRRGDEGNGDQEASRVRWTR